MKTFIFSLLIIGCLVGVALLVISRSDDEQKTDTSSSSTGKSFDTLSKRIPSSDSETKQFPRKTKMNDGPQQKQRSMGLDANENAEFEESFKEGVKLLEEGNFVDAINLLEKLREAGESAEQVQEALGYAYLGNGQIDQAEQLFAEALANDPNNPEWNFGLAMVKRRQGEMEEAAKLLEHNIELDPSDIEAKYELADLYTFDTKTRAEDAARYYEETLNEQPDNPEALNGLAAAYLNQGKTEEAVRIWEDMVGKEPDNSILLSNLCEAYLEGGDASKGRSQCQKAVEIDPTNSEAYYLLAKDSKNSGNLQEARTLVLKALEVSPENEQYHQFLADIQNSSM